MRSIIFLLLIFFSQILFAQQAFKVGVVPFKSDAALNQTFDALTLWIKQSTGLKVQIQYVDKDELGYLLSRGHLEMGVFRPIAYLQTKDVFPELQVSLTHQVNNKDAYTAYILVDKQSGINSIQELRGKRFTFIKPSSTSGYLIPKGMLKERGINAEDFFASIDFSYSHDRSIEMLQQKETDVIAVSDEDLDEQSIALLKSFNTLLSFQIPHAAYVFAPGLSDDMKLMVVEALIDAKRNPAARTLLRNSLHITGWKEANDELYNPLRRFMGIDRLKPAVQLELNLGGRAKTVFESRGDMLDILKRRIINELKASNRFQVVDEKPGDQKSKISIELSQLEDGYFNYHIMWNNELVGDADIDEATMLAVLPSMIRFSVLSNIPINTQLAFDGENWFVPYGLNDGLNEEDYTIYVRTSEGMMRGNMIEMNELNTLLANHVSFKEGNTVSISYTRLDLFSEEQNNGSGTLVLPTKAEFWEDDFWDKFGLLVSISLAAISGLVTWYFSTRKKRNFKKVLKDANHLLEAYVQDNNRMKTDLIEIKDTASQMLEKGEITENQFLIIKHRLDEIEHQIREQRIKS